MTRDAATSFSRTLVDEWVRHGISDACLAPGSRSTPLALALAGDPRIRVHVHLDERSASFFAIGIGRATGRPAVVLCTSGTAAANFHPAVLEAAHGRVPMVVCTADRPPELRDAGAGQTIDQVKLYGAAVRWAVDAGVPDDRPAAGAEWRALASRAVAAAVGPPAGPVHMNLPFREPLVPTGAPLVEAAGRSDGRPWTARIAAERVPGREALEALAELVRRSPRGALVAGHGAHVRDATLVGFSDASGWPVLADAVSGMRVPGTVSTYDPLLRVPGFAESWRPDVVLRIGGPPTNRPLSQWLGPDVPQVLVDPDDAWLDPQHATGGRVRADPQPLLEALARELAPRADAAWHERWTAVDKHARHAVDALLDEWSVPFEGRVARDVMAALPDGASLVVASSMPVRDLESFAAPRTGVCVHANRGVNGIDGFVSTALGVAASSGGPTVAVVGDLCLLHDTNGLLGASRRGIDATFVVLDNDGGGIFSFLAQAELPDHFETLFGTPHGVDIAALARVYGMESTVVDRADDLTPALAESMETGGVGLLVVRTDRVDNVTRHRAVWEAVARAVADEI